MNAQSTPADVFQLIDREIWIVTAADTHRRGGLVATWVAQANLDLDRPQVQIAIARNHFTSELVDASGAFALHLIERGQIEHVWNFGIGSGRDRDKLKGLPAATSITGAPILQDCLAWMDCRVFTQLDAGDRIIYWADVVAAARHRHGQPLRAAAALAAADSSQLEALEDNLRRDIDIQRPLNAAWRTSVPRHQP